MILFHRMTEGGIIRLGFNFIPVQEESYCYNVNDIGPWWYLLFAIPVFWKRWFMFRILRLLKPNKVCFTFELANIHPGVESTYDSKLYNKDRK